jgi:formylglycine-generating enzyme required for sulfatase activity
MQTKEVTQGQWKIVMGDNPCYFQYCGDDCPVEQVSWKDVQQFIWRLNQLEGAEKYRLPTEAEWEYACRAGSATAFSSGGITELECGHDPNLDVVAWFCGNSDKKTRPVGRKNPNAWGLYDMHGNVSEFCHDWYGEYPDGEVTDPTGPASGLDRMVRGGGVDTQARHCRAGCRGALAPDAMGYDVGFRLVRMP